MSPGDRLTLAGDVLANNNFFVRGDEGNDLARIGNFAVLNLRSDYQVNDHLNVFLNIDNVLDEEYETFGLLGEADEVLGYAVSDNRFFFSAMPRAVWLGVRLTL